MRLLVPPLLLATLLGCNLVDRPTDGELGVARFAYNEGLFGCIFGCDADEPLALDARATVLVLNGNDLAPIHVRSDNPGVLQVTEVEGDEEGWPSALVAGVAEGDAGLVVEDDDGGLIDVLSMRVRAIDHIEVGQPDVKQVLQLTEGRQMSLRLDLLSKDDEALAGVGAVDWSLGDLETVPQGGPVELAVAEYVDELFLGTTRETASVTAGATGTSGVIQARASTGARLDLPVQVVDPQVITDLELEVVGRPKKGEQFTVQAHGFTPDGERVYDPVCDWTLDPRGTEAVEVSTGEDYDTVQPERMGSMTITCAMGDVEAHKKVWVLE